MTSLRGARVLLTGATGGLGEAIARELAARGARMLLTGRRAERLEALAAELPQARTHPADLADRAALDALTAHAGEIDVFVGNAGVPGTGRLDEYTASQVDRALDVNLRAPMQLARALVAPMRARGRGHLVFVASLASKAPAGGMSVYAATKFALRGFALSLRDELHGSGVGVSLVTPGFIRDAGMFAEAGVSLPPGVRTRSPGEVAVAVVGAIERDRGEVEVAPLALRLGATVSNVAPGLAATVQRRLGSAALAERFAEGQRAKR